ncbi:MAG: 50S ribosomal protein L6 [Microgenomates group bacterium]
MSRIGRKPILIPEGVTVEITNGQVLVKGPKGELPIKIRPEIKVEKEENKLIVKKVKNSRQAQCLWGTIRSLIANAVEGVTQGFTKTLKIVGTGYRVIKEGEDLVLSLGFSHPVRVTPPPGINFETEKNDTIKVMGIDKALVGKTAAEIRAIKPPDAYKGKGIRYEGEEVKLKPGKAGKAGAAGGGA